MQILSLSKGLVRLAGLGASCRWSGRHEDLQNDSNGIKRIKSVRIILTCTSLIFIVPSAKIFHVWASAEYVDALTVSRQFLGTLLCHIRLYVKHIQTSWGTWIWNYLSYILCNYSWRKPYCRLQYHECHKYHIGSNLLPCFGASCVLGSDPAAQNPKRQCGPWHHGAKEGSEGTGRRVSTQRRLVLDSGVQVAVFKRIFLHTMSASPQLYPCVPMPFTR